MNQCSCWAVKQQQLLTAWMKMTQTSPLPAQLPWNDLCWLLNPQLLSTVSEGTEDDDLSLITPSISALFNSKDINLLKHVVTEHYLCLVWVSRSQDMPAQDYSGNTGQSQQHSALRGKPYKKLPRKLLFTMWKQHCGQAAPGLCPRYCESSTVPWSVFRVPAAS